MATSFKRPHAGTATLSSRDPAAGHHRTTPPLETPRHSRASLCRLLWGHCPFLLGPGKHKVLFVPSKALFPQLYVSSAGCMLGLMATSSKWAYATFRSTEARAPALQQSAAYPYFRRRHSNTVLSHLCGISGSWFAQGLFEPLSFSGGYGV